MQWGLCALATACSSCGRFAGAVRAATRGRRKQVARRRLSAAALSASGSIGLQIGVPIHIQIRKSQSKSKSQISNPRGHTLEAGRPASSSRLKLDNTELAARLTRTLVGGSRARPRVRGPATDIEGQLSARWRRAAGGHSLGRPVVTWAPFACRPGHLAPPSRRRPPVGRSARPRNPAQRLAGDKLQSQLP